MTVQTNKRWGEPRFRYEYDGGWIERCEVKRSNYLREPQPRSFRAVMPALVLTHVREQAAVRSVARAVDATKLRAFVHQRTVNVEQCCFKDKMGRTQPTVVVQPQSFRRAARAKKAKETVNRTIPALLSSYPRARRGIDFSELIANPPAIGPRPDRGDEYTSSGLSIRLQVTDALSAARSLVTQSKRVAVLNMASPLRPGGGFLQGATSQEEYLCMRSTLYPSLREQFYRLPEVGCIYSPDILVFRDADANDLPKKDRYFVDVVSAGMLRFPELKQEDGDGDGGRFADPQDRDLTMEKMRAVMRVMQSKGAERIVLGAWGCGAYSNPVIEIAQAWRKVLFGSSKSRKKGRKTTNRDDWAGIEDIVFAVPDELMAKTFHQHFGQELQLEESEKDDSHVIGDDQNSREAQEIEERIQQLEEQIAEARTQTLQAGLQSVLRGLKEKLAKLEQPLVENMDEEDGGVPLQDQDYDLHT